MIDDVLNELEMNKFEGFTYVPSEPKINPFVPVAEPLQTTSQPNSRFEDKQWLRIDNSTLFDEEIVDEKFYEALQQLKQNVIEGVPGESLVDAKQIPGFPISFECNINFNLGFGAVEEEELEEYFVKLFFDLNLEDEFKKYYFFIFKILRKREQEIKSYLQRLWAECAGPSTISNLMAKRMKVLQRIHLALSREKERRLVILG
jgi:hypothetical protein